MSPFQVRPGVWLKVSQMEGPRPSSWAAPSIWYAAVAAPSRKSFGMRTGRGYSASSAVRRSSVRSPTSSMPTDRRTTESGTSSSVPRTDAWVISDG